jgi:lactoylglutathione lyase
MTAPNLAYVILYVPDVLASIAFWEKAFGLTRRFLHESNEYAELETGSTTLAFSAEALIQQLGLPHRPNRRDHPPAGIEVALATKELNALFERATNAGAEVVKPPETKPWGQVTAYVRDPDGILVELCTPMR